VVFVSFAIGAVSVVASFGIQTFRVGVDAVHVDALVTERNRPVAGLTAADFVLLDNGVPQDVQSASMQDVPISLMLTFDVSESVAERVDDLRAAAQAALSTLDSKDRASILTFSEVVDLRTGWTGDFESVSRVLSTAAGEGGTALYDGTFAALTLRDTAPGRRSLLILFSDGADTWSWLPPSVVAEKARRTDLVAYTVGLGGASRARARVMDAPVMYRSGIELLPGVRAPLTPREFLEGIADLTGGRAYEVQDTKRLRAEFERIVREFRTRYVLTYMPRGVESDGWHRIDVRLKNGRGDVTARRGYQR
jgi:VWFA-related protein